MKPYYEHAGTRDINGRFAVGHKQPKSAEHRASLSKAAKLAWSTKRRRMPIGRTWLDASGYIRVKVAEGKGRWRLEHVLVMERETGRPIQPGEIVHHINGDRRDNRPENLYLCRDHAHHNEVHRSQDVALRQLLAAGLVVFREGKYEAVFR